MGSTVVVYLDEKSNITITVTSLKARFEFVSRQSFHVIMGTMGSQITGVSIILLTIYSGAGQRKLQSSELLTFVRGIQRGRRIPCTKGR